MEAALAILFGILELAIAYYLSNKVGDYAVNYINSKRSISAFIDKWHPSVVKVINVLLYLILLFLFLRILNLIIGFIAFATNN